MRSEILEPHIVTTEEFTVWLGRMLETLENFPEARQAVVAELKEWGLVMESAEEDDLRTSEPFGERN